MSFSLDVNILVHASNDSSDLNQPARNFIGRCLAGPEMMVLGFPVLFSYLRISTHSGIFPKPLLPSEALDNVRSLLAPAHVRVVSEQAEYFHIYTALTATDPPRGNQVPDSHLAILLRQHEVTTIYTTDRDFSRFPFLRAVNPFLPQ